MIYVNKDKHRIKLMKVTLSLPHNSYIDAPQAHPNLILGTLQLAVWIFFHPTAWRNHIKRIDENLRPDFSLAELKPSHWRHPGLRRLLIQAYLILPFFLALLSILWLGNLLEDFDFFIINLLSTILSTTTYSLIAGITTSVAVGIGANLALALVSPVMTIALLNFLYLINGELASNFGAVVHDAVSLGVSYGVIGSIAFYLGRQTPTASLKMRIKGIAAGTLCFFLLNVAENSIYQLGTANFQTNSLLGLAVILTVISLLRGISLGWAVGWELNHRRRGLIIGIALALFLAGISIMGFVGNSTTVNESLLTVYRIAFSVSTGAIPAIGFALPFVVGRKIGGAIAGVGAFVLCGVLQQILAPTTDLRMLLIPLLGINLGLTQTKWRSLLLYPLMLVWNFVSVSRLRLNSAFWDEFQGLPLLGLEEQLVVAAENKPAEGYSAIAYLLNTPQKAAAQGAKIELMMRSLEDCNHIEAIAAISHQYNRDEFSAEIPVWIETLWAMSRQVEVAINQESQEEQHLGLIAVAESLASLRREMDAKGDRFAPRCQGIVNSWQQILAS